MDFYRILRENKELGPFSLDELKKIGLKSSDLIWIDGKSAAWSFPDEIVGLFTKLEKKDTPVIRQDTVIENVPKPKKRYRLTADHRMVEITEEEAESSQIPRIAEQPPAPKEELLLNSNPIVNHEKKLDVGISDEPFSKRTVAAPDTNELPLEPELVSKPRTIEPVKEFVDIDQDKEAPEEMGNGKQHSNNAGAFVFAGLLFLVAIGFFGYKWYQDQNTQQTTVSDSTKMALDTTTSKDESFANSQAMALTDDTSGQMERKKEMMSIDSVRRKRLADERAAIARAKKDSVANIAPIINTDTTHKTNVVTNNPIVPHKTDTSKGKVKKILTTEDIGKYVKVGVVQPNNGVGVKGVKLVVHNINNRNLAKVHINVMYFDDNGNIIKRATIIAPNVLVGKSVTIPVADDPKASNVSYQVTGLLGDHVNLQAN